MGGASRWPRGEAGHQEDQVARSPVGPPSRSRGGGWRGRSIRSSAVEIQRASALVSTLNPGRMACPCAPCFPCPTHLFHLAVLKLFFFFN